MSIRKTAENKKWEDRKLSEHLTMNKAERPDEWQMDEFIRMAVELEKAIEPPTDEG